MHFILILFCLPLFLLTAQEVQVGVESQEVYLHEPFLFQIRISADDAADAPVLPPLPGFSVVAQSPQHSRSSQLSIINGRRTQSITTTSIFNYSLTPQKLGTLIIPSLNVAVKGTIKRTQPIQIIVRQAETIDGIALLLQASSKECYVGEPIMLTWRWYIDRQIYQYNFNLPLLTLPDFSFPNYLPEIDPNRQRQYQRIANVQDAELIALQTNARYKGKAASLLTFEKPFIPLKPGTYSLPDSTVLCEVEDPRGGSSQPKRRSPFDGFDDFFGQTRKRTRKITVSAPPVTITVKSLPTDNQPENFSGIVGSCHISATAEPREVNVGDPILLTITLNGPRFLEHLKLPPWEKQPGLAGKFKISNEEPGQVEKNVKIFQCTLRANHPDLTEIPALEVPFFNSQKGTYDFARSTPIPIQVSPVRQVTLQDAQGTPVAAGENNGHKELQISDIGIAHNYDATAIVSAHNHDPRQWLASRRTQCLLLFPPGIWLLATLGTSWFRRHNANPRAWAARKAGSACMQSLKTIKPDATNALDQIFEIIQKYLTAKFQLNPGIVTYSDLNKILQAKNIDPQYCLPFKAIFAACEASRFAGAGSHSAQEILTGALSAVRTLEKVV
ncbi:MAG: BatD family protein [Lentisphaeria bacterium]